MNDAKNQIFRLEKLQDYSGEDGDQVVKDFLKTGDIAFDEEDPWWNNIKTLNDKGITTQRVRLLLEPLTNYTKMELCYLEKACAYSKDKLITIRENEYQKIDKEDAYRDFWLIDDTYLFIGNYTEKGKLINWDFHEGHESTFVKNYTAFKNKLLNSVSIN